MSSEVFERQSFLEVSGLGPHAEQINLKKGDISKKNIGWKKCDLASNIIINEEELLKIRRYPVF